MRPARHLAVTAGALLLLACGGLAQPSGPVVVQEGLARSLPSPWNASTALVARGDGTVQLRLCECERATGPPSGLSCDKEGWFISSFERQGQWVAGGGYVPLSHAICCRPCLPDELPADPSGRIPGGQKPLAIISLGCHSSTDVLPSRCELGASSFVQGFAEAVKVFTTPDTYYPTNTAQCCTPALLLENGDAWELERCGCHDSHDPSFPVSCGGTNSDELLLGFIFFRLSPLGHVVPVGPAQCCRTCLSSTVHPMNQCDDLNACSGHGVCNMRRCECFDGWTGADCSQSARGRNSIPPWAIALIVLSSCSLAGMLIAAAGFALQALNGGGLPGGSEDGEGEERQPLLIRIDADDCGSVGSQDTSDGEDEVDVDEVERRVNRTIARLEHAAEGRSGPAPAAAAAGPEGGDAGAAARQEGVNAGGAPAAEQQGGQQQPAGCSASGQQAGDAESEAVPAAGDSAAAESPAEASAAPTATAAAEDEAGALPAEGAASAAAAAAAEVEFEEPVKPPRDPGCGPTPEGPLAMVDCVVCMSRPVQVVGIPCGHVCMCRRCSRRLQRCPVCRKELARRQRLYV